jgi:hypothetical protein
MLFMELTEFYFLIVPLVVLLMVLIPVILHYARKEEHSSKELRHLKKKIELNPQIRQGPEAIRFLGDFVRKMEESEAGDMTEQQAKAMIKVAQVLISAINKETTILDKLRHTDLIPKLKATMEKLIQQISTDHETEVDEQIVDRESEVLNKPKNLKML